MSRTHPIHARRIREDDALAFLDEQGNPIGDGHAPRLGMPQFLAREFLRGATSGEGPVAESLDEVLTEELGGPFVESSAAAEFGPTVSGSEDPSLGDEFEATPTAGAPLVVKWRRK